MTFLDSVRLVIGFGLIGFFIFWSIAVVIQWAGFSFPLDLGLFRWAGFSLGFLIGLVIVLDDEGPK